MNEATCHVCGDAIKDGLCVGCTFPPSECACVEPKKDDDASAELAKTE